MMVGDGNGLMDIGGFANGRKNEVGTEVCGR